MRMKTVDECAQQAHTTKFTLTTIFWAFDSGDRCGSASKQILFNSGICMKKLLFYSNYHRFQICYIPLYSGIAVSLHYSSENRKLLSRDLVPVAN